MQYYFPYSQITNIIVSKINRCVAKYAYFGDWHVYDIAPEAEKVAVHNTISELYY